MNKKEYLKQIRIDVIGNTIFITNRYFNFSYTPANDICKEEYKDKYRYFGGLQSEFNEDSKEFTLLDDWLCKIAENVLKSIG